MLFIILELYIRTNPFDSPFDSFFGRPDVRPVKVCRALKHRQAQLQSVQSPYATFRARKRYRMARRNQPRRLLRFFSLSVKAHEQDYRMARRFAWVFAAPQKPKFHYKRNVWGAFWSFWPPRAPPECPRSAPKTARYLRGVRTGAPKSPARKNQNPVSGSITLATALFREYFQECGPIFS